MNSLALVGENTRHADERRSLERGGFVEFRQGRGERHQLNALCKSALGGRSLQALHQGKGVMREGSTLLHAKFVIKIQERNNTLTLSKLFTQSGPVIGISGTVIGNHRHYERDLGGIILVQTSGYSRFECIDHHRRCAVSFIVLDNNMNRDRNTLFGLLNNSGGLDAGDQHARGKCQSILVDTAGLEARTLESLEPGIDRGQTADTAGLAIEPPVFVGTFKKVDARVRHRFNKRHNTIHQKRIGDALKNGRHIFIEC